MLATMVTIPNESKEYREARNRLLEREASLRREMEAIAAERRALPLGPEVAEYVFRDSNGEVKLSSLFAPKTRSLAVYSFMFPREPGDTRSGPDRGKTAALPLAEGPCPSCTALLDQLDGMIPHTSRFVNFAVVAEAPIDRLIAFAEDRGWRHLRLLSSGGTTYQRDFHGAIQNGNPRPVLNVFEREGATVRHFWASELLYAPTDPGQDPRHVGTLEPLWNLYDLTRDGRGQSEEREEQLTTCCH